MNALENDLAEAKDEITRLRVQCDAKDNVIEAHRAFRAAATVALAELRADCEQQVFLIGGINDDYAEGVKFALKSLDATITALGLEEAK